MPPSRTIDAEAKIGALAIHPGGAEFAVGVKTGRLQVFSISGKVLRSFSLESPALVLAYSGDGRRILAGCGKSAAVFDSATGNRLASWAAHGEDIGAIACSRDGSLIATASGYERVKLWKGDGAPLRTLESGPEVLNVAVFPGGDRVAEAASDTKLRIFSASSGALQRAVEFAMACPVIAFSSDGRTLAVGSVDGSVSLLDAASGESRGALGRHAIPVGRAAFSPDGKRLATTSLSMNPWGADADWKLWDLSAGKEIATTPIGPSFLNAAGFASSGQPVVLSVKDQTVSVWS